MGDNIFYIYGDYTDDGRPFYFGKGSGKRYQTERKNKYWKYIANKYGWNRKIILSTKDEEYAFDLEVSYIRKYKTFEKDWKDKSDWGANFTKGGEGPSGRIPSKETREKMSMAGRGKLLPEETKRKISEINMGHIVSEETKKKISRSNKGKTHSEETRKEMSRSRKGRVHSKETRIKISESNKGRVHSEETKKKISESKKGKIGKPCSEEAKIKISKFMSGENAPSAKLNQEKVTKIRTLISEEKSNIYIASIYNISPSAISKIKNGNTWTT